MKGLNFVTSFCKKYFSTIFYSFVVFALAIVLATWVLPDTINDWFLKLEMVNESLSVSMDIMPATLDPVKFLNTAIILTGIIVLILITITTPHYADVIYTEEDVKNAQIPSIIARVCVILSVTVLIIGTTNHSTKLKEMNLEQRQTLLEHTFNDTYVHKGNYISKDGDIINEYAVIPNWDIKNARDSFVKEFNIGDTKFSFIEVDNNRLFYKKE